MGRIEPRYKFVQQLQNDHNFRFAGQWYLDENEELAYDQLIPGIKDTVWVFSVEDEVIFVGFTSVYLREAMWKIKSPTTKTQQKLYEYLQKTIDHQTIKVWHRGAESLRQLRNQVLADFRPKLNHVR